MKTGLRLLLGLLALLGFGGLLGLHLGRQVAEQIHASELARLLAAEVEAHHAGKRWGGLPGLLGRFAAGRSVAAAAWLDREGKVLESAGPESGAGPPREVSPGVRPAQEGERWDAFARVEDLGSVWIRTRAVSLPPWVLFVPLLAAGVCLRGLLRLAPGREDRGPQAS